MTCAYQFSICTFSSVQFSHINRSVRCVNDMLKGRLINVQRLPVPDIFFFLLLHSNIKPHTANDGNYKSSPWTMCVREQTTTPIVWVIYYVITFVNMYGTVPAAPNPVSCIVVKISRYFITHLFPRLVFFNIHFGLIDRKLHSNRRHEIDEQKYNKFVWIQCIYCLCGVSISGNKTIRSTNMNDSILVVFNPFEFSYLFLLHIIIAVVIIAIVIVIYCCGTSSQNTIRIFHSIHNVWLTLCHSLLYRHKNAFTNVILQLCQGILMVI